MCYLRCPTCREPLVDVDPLRRTRCDRSYPVVDGIPAC
jgi:uncharacterized protein YbaR (Trm112 family)